MFQTLNIDKNGEFTNQYIDDRGVYGVNFLSFCKPFTVKASNHEFIQTFIL